MTELNLNRIVVLKDFVNPQLFPYVKKWDNQSILCLDGDEEIIALLEKQFPESGITPVKGTRLLEEQHQGDSMGKYSFIVALGINYGKEEARRVLGELVKRLNPGGVVAASVHGYTGYYGLEMLSRIVKHYSGDMGNDRKTTAKIIKTVLAGLPDNHPARRQDAFIKRLERGDNSAIDTLEKISEGNIFTVTQLLELIRESEGRLLEWIYPGAYDPAGYITDSADREALEKLPEPQRWEVAELVNARPPVHYAFIGREADVPFKIPWSGGDLYQWRPQRLPLYRWEECPETADTEGTVTPLYEAEEYGIVPVKLPAWQMGLCSLSDGTATLNRIQASLNVSPVQIRTFMETAVKKRLLALLPPG